MSEYKYNYSNGYPLHRPIKHYRKSGFTNTQMKYNEECCTGSYKIGDEYKLLGKNVYVIDVYRSPIECKISTFFEKVGVYHFNNFIVIFSFLN